MFEPVGDRYLHRWELDAPGGVCELLRSIELGADDAWPLSPPLQQVHIERSQPGRQIALAVGMAGRSHWSASFELLDDGRRLQAEIACRCLSAPRWLGSRYRISANDEKSALLTFTNLVDAVLGDTSPTSDASEVQLNAVWQPGTWPRTLQWRYVVEHG